MLFCLARVGNSACIIQSPDPFLNLSSKSTVKSKTRSLGLGLIFPSSWQKISDEVKCMFCVKIYEHCSLWTTAVTLFNLDQLSRPGFYFSVISFNVSLRYVLVGIYGSFLWGITINFKNGKTFIDNNQDNSRTKIYRANSDICKCMEPIL